MKRPTTPAEWEQLLRSEGMPGELPTSRRQALIDVTDLGLANGNGHATRGRPGADKKTDRINGGLATSGTFQYWTMMTHAANALPRNWKGRQFVIAYAETGYFHATCETHGLTRREGEAVLVRFAKYTKEHDESDHHER